MYMNTDRSGGSESVDALVAGAAGVIRASQGRASAAPAPRNTVLREIRFAIFLTPYLLYDHRTLPLRRRRRGGNRHHATLAIPERGAQHNLTDHRPRPVFVLLQR